jgi:acyl-CoA reductase-like NAD-dependent aldehyde dehydrogenase
VVLIVSPWNYPCNLALVPLIGALAAGNTVFLKVSAYAANTANTLVELIPRYLDTSCVVMEGCGGRHVIKQLLLNKWDHIFFTGSVSVGRIIGEAAGRNLTPCTLELGGKNPCIVDDTIDLRLAARRIAWGKFFNTGQTCIGVDYVLCDAAVEAAFIVELKLAVVQFYGEDPHASTSYGRIITEAHTRRLQGLLQHGEVVHGGKVVVAEKYVAPTILRAVNLDSELMTDEIFGPLLPIVTYADLSEALRFVNQRPICLALYLFSSDSQRQEQVLTGTRSGSAVINDVLMQFTNSALPFGGCGESGMGAYHGKCTFDTFTHRRAVIKSTSKNWLDLPLRYPPYSEKKYAPLVVVGERL